MLPCVKFSFKMKHALHSFGSLQGPVVEPILFFFVQCLVVSRSSASRLEGTSIKYIY